MDNIDTVSDNDQNRTESGAISNNPFETNGPIRSISIKSPVFYRNNPTIWFRQLESQFALSGVRSTKTKFHHVMSVLPEDVAINLTIPDENYEQIKEQVCAIYQKTKQELLEEALGSVSLDGQKPSVCLLKIKRKMADCGVQAQDDVIRHRLLQAMPTETKIALSAHSSLPLVEFSKLADTIYSYTQNDYNVSAVSPKEQYPTRNKFEPIRNQFAQHSTGTSYESKPFSDGQRPKICRFHLFYASKAKRCKPWCKWPGQKPAVIEPNSRPASPVSQQGN